MTSGSTTGTPLDLTRRLARNQSVVAVALLFALNGLIIGGYGGALPSIRERLDIGATQIAALLFTAGLVGIVAMQVSGRLCDAIGARQVSLAGLPLLILAATTFAFATSYPLAVTGAVLLGLGNGTIDVAMNAVGVQVESARKRPIMSSFHALWSVGGLVGAASVLVMARVLGLDGAAIVMPLMLTLAAMTLIGFAVALKITPPTALIQHTTDGVKTKIPTIAWLLAILAVAFGLSRALPPTGRRSTSPRSPTSTRQPGRSVSSRSARSWSSSGSSATGSSPGSAAAPWSGSAAVARQSATRP